MFEGHDPYLVALSVVIAILGGFTGFGLAARIRTTPGVSRRVLLSGAAAFLAVGDLSETVVPADVDSLTAALGSRRILIVAGICVTLAASIAIGLYELLVRLEH